MTLTLKVAIMFLGATDCLIKANISAKIFEYPLIHGEVITQANKAGLRLGIWFQCMTLTFWMAVLFFHARHHFIMLHTCAKSYENPAIYSKVRAQRISKTNINWPTNSSTFTTFHRVFVGIIIPQITMMMINKTKFLLFHFLFPFQLQHFSKLLHNSNTSSKFLSFKKLC